MLCYRAVIVICLLVVLPRVDGGKTTSKQTKNQAPFKGLLHCSIFSCLKHFGVKKLTVLLFWRRIMKEECVSFQMSPRRTKSKPFRGLLVHFSAALHDFLSLKHFGVKKLSGAPVFGFALLPPSFIFTSKTRAPDSFLTPKCFKYEKIEQCSTKMHQETLKRCLILSFLGLFESLQTPLLQFAA